MYYMKVQLTCPIIASFFIILIQIVRKVAYQLVNAEKDPPILVNSDNLTTYVGQPIWTSDRLYDSITPPGVVMGLAWTSMGGSVLYIECTNKKPKYFYQSTNTTDSHSDSSSDSEEVSNKKGTFSEFFYF